MDNFVSVCLITYNHKNYIKEAIEGVIQQRVKYSWNLIIADDCSNDGTSEILISYKERFPEFIDLILRTKNVGPAKNFTELQKTPKSKNIANIEGDDLRTDPKKLQKQIDFLESRPEIAGCFHDVIVVDENSRIIKEDYYRPDKEIFNQRDCLIYGGAYCTGSLMFRSIVLTNIPEWFLKSPSDYAIDLLITEFGGIAHLSENMGAYRIHKGGTWQGNSEHKNLEKVIERFQICMTYPKFRKEYGVFFHKKIGELSARVALHYNKDRNYMKKMKYVWNYTYYTRPKNMAFIKYLIGTLLFPSIHNMTGRFFSKRNKRSEA